MNTKRLLTALVGIGSIFFLAGCYTQVATNPDRQEDYSNRQDQAYEQSDTTAPAQAQEEYTEEDNRPYRSHLGFQYYYPSWSSFAYYDDPWWPSVSFGYYYDGWACGTPYVYYPWYRTYYPYYYHSGYGWAYSHFPNHGYATSTYGSGYTTRNIGVRRGGTAGSRDDGGYRGGGGTPSGMTLPTAGRTAGYGTAGTSRSTSTSGRGLNAIFGGSDESRAATSRSSAASGRDAATSTRGGAVSTSPRDNPTTGRIVAPSRSREGGRRSYFTYPQAGATKSGKSSTTEGRHSYTPSRQESSRPSYSPPARSGSSSSPAPSSSGGSRSGGSSGESRGSSPRR
jgi:hypothetical protein